MIREHVVASSNIRKIAYDSDTLTLKVTFTSGTIYAYKPVTEKVVDDFVKSSSKGTFFAQNIKGKFSFTKA